MYVKSQVPGGKPRIFSENPGFPGPGFSLNPGIWSRSMEKKKEERRGEGRRGFANL